MKRAAQHHALRFERLRAPHRRQLGASTPSGAASSRPWSGRAIATRPRSTSTIASSRVQVCAGARRRRARSAGSSASVWDERRELRQPLRCDPEPRCGACRRRHASRVARRSSELRTARRSIVRASRARSESQPSAARRAARRRRAGRAAPRRRRARWPRVERAEIARRRVRRRAAYTPHAPAAPRAARRPETRTAARSGSREQSGDGSVVSRATQLDLAAMDAIEDRGERRRSPSPPAGSRGRSALTSG